MAIGTVLGKAYIEIHADAKPFAKELGVDIEAIAKSTAVKKAGEKVGEKIGDGVKDGVKKKIEKDSTSLFASIRRSWTRDADKNRGFWSKLGSASATAFGDGMTKGLSLFTGLLTSVGSSIGNVGSKGPFAALLGGLILAGIPALIGLVIGLVHQLGALVNVVGLLPGVLFTAAAAIVPVVIGFQGFGDALGAILSRDPKAIAEALKQLTPSARKVAQEFQKMLPFFTAVRKSTQEALFKPLIGGLTQLQKALGPTFQKGFTDVADRAGVFIRGLITMLSSPQSKTFFKNLFDAAEVVWTKLGPGFTQFIAGIIAIADESLPTLTSLVERLGGFLGGIGSWLIGTAEDGRFQEFLDDFVVALDKMIELSKSGWNLVKAIIGSANEGASAEAMFDAIIESIDKMTEFFKSEEGKKGLQAMVELARIFVFLVLAAVVGFVTILGVLRDIHNILSPTVKLAGELATIRRIGGTTGAGGLRDRNFAEGGIADRPTYGWTGEDGPEAIIPLTNPDRAREVIQEAGLGSMTGGDTDIVVYIGDEQVMARVERRVRKAFDNFGKGMRFGPRPVGAGG